MNTQVKKDPSKNPPDAASEKGSLRNQTLEDPPRNRLGNYQALRRSRLRRLWLKAYIRFIRLRGEPREIALGFALGLFIATSPTMGVQMVLAIFIAALFKWSKIAAAIAVWVTNPLTAPFIYGLTYVIGAKILGLSTLRGLVGEPTLSTLLNAIKKAPELLAALTLGGIVLGIPLAIAGYYLSHAALLKYQRGLKAKLQIQKERLRLKRKRLKEKVDLQKERIRLKKESLKKKRGQRKKARMKKKR